MRTSEIFLIAAALTAPASAWRSSSTWGWSWGAPTTPCETSTWAPSTSTWTPPVPESTSWSTFTETTLVSITSCPGGCGESATYSPWTTPYTPTWTPTTSPVPTSSAAPTTVPVVPVISSSSSNSLSFSIPTTVATAAPSVQSANRAEPVRGLSLGAIIMGAVGAVFAML